jgi:hypothetical protein
VLLVIGGHSRNIGKTSVAEGVIRSLPEACWTAVKITQFGHGICSSTGEGCECRLDYEHPYAVVEQRQADGSDSGRFLAAGAVRSFWVRTAMGQLGHAAPALREIFAESGNVVVESNSVLNFFRPDFYVVVLDYSVSDMKDSTRRFLNRADALVEIGERPIVPPWPGVPGRWLGVKPAFPARPGRWVAPELTRLVREKLQTNGK